MVENFIAREYSRKREKAVKKGRLEERMPQEDETLECPIIQGGGSLQSIAGEDLATAGAGRSCMRLRLIGMLLRENPDLL